jgi:hypothetical protein
MDRKSVEETSLIVVNEFFSKSNLMLFSYKFSLQNSDGIILYEIWYYESKAFVYFYKILTIHKFLENPINQRSRYEQDTYLTRMHVSV